MAPATPSRVDRSWALRFVKLHACRRSDDHLFGSSEATLQGESMSSHGGNNTGHEATCSWQWLRATVLGLVLASLGALWSAVPALGGELKADGAGPEGVDLRWAPVRRGSAG